jgi:hypothetical protein
LPPGQALREPAPLFKKLDESVVEEEYARLEGYQIADLKRAGAQSPALITSISAHPSDQFIKAVDW